jgi:hypothetical protein
MAREPSLLVRVVLPDGALRMGMPESGRQEPRPCGAGALFVKSAAGQKYCFRPTPGFALDQTCVLSSDLRDTRTLAQARSFTPAAGMLNGAN